MKALLIITALLVLPSLAQAICFVDLESQTETKQLGASAPIDYSTINSNAEAEEVNFRKILKLIRTSPAVENHNKDMCAAGVRALNNVYNSWKMFECDVNLDNLQRTEEYKVSRGVVKARCSSEVNQQIDIHLYAFAPKPGDRPNLELNSSVNIKINDQTSADLLKSVAAKVEYTF